MSCPLATRLFGISTWEASGESEYASITAQELYICLDALYNGESTDYYVKIQLTDSSDVVANLYFLCGTARYGMFGAGDFLIGVVDDTTYTNDGTTAIDLSTYSLSGSIKKVIVEAQCYSTTTEIAYECDFIDLK